MENGATLSLVADILAIVSLLLSMYFYYAARTKEIDELRKVIESKSRDDFNSLKHELKEIKNSIEHLNKETFDLLKNQVSFMQQQVGKVGEKSPTKPDVEILNIIMIHKRITIDSLCMQFIQIDRFIVIKYVEEFRERGALTFDGTVIKIAERNNQNEEES